MSELQNPLFDEEKEFLERKKLEYERALRGDVEHIKDQSVMVGKVALVGAGLVGSIWLITKAFRGKGKKKKQRASSAAYVPYKSAADSASAFIEQYEPEHAHEGDDLGFGSTAAPPRHEAEPAAPYQYEPSAHDTEEFEDDPFQDLPYDDSRRLPTSHAFDDASTPAAKSKNSRSRMLGSVLQAFLQSDTGKVLVSQVAAVGLALVTKKVSEFFPAAKNSDLATSPGHAPVAPGDNSVASPASPVSSDASTNPQST